MSENTETPKIPRDVKMAGLGFAGALVVVFAFSGGEPDEIVEVNLPQVDTYLATELATPAMQQLRQDMIRCGADFEVGVNVDDGSYAIDYDTKVDSNSRPCMLELEQARITADQDIPAEVIELGAPVAE